MLSVEAVGVLMLAWSISGDDGTIQPAANVTAREALVFVATQHAQQSGVVDSFPAHPRATDAVDELVGCGLLIAEGDVLWLDGWIVLDGTPQRPLPPPTDDRPSDTKRAPGRPRKADAPLTPAERQERRRFDRRERGFRDVPAGMTWEQWRAENPVTKLPAAGHETLGAGHENPPAGHENSGHETPASPRASSSGERKETRNIGERESGTRGSGHENPGHETLGGHENPGESFRDQPRCSTVEALSPFDALDVLDRMRKASGDRLATNLHTATTAQEFATVARDLIAREVTTAEGLVKAASHAPHDRWLSTQGKLPLARLLASDGKILLDLIAGAATCKACGGDPLASGVIELPAPQRDRNGRPVQQPVMARDYLARRGVTVPGVNPAPAPSPAPEVSRAR